MLSESSLSLGMVPSVDDTVTYSVQLNSDNQDLGIILGRNIAWYTTSCICCILIIQVSVILGSL